ncbi:MAG: four helix bundle protein [Candidatus Omnitrophota bacterium]|nr:four helix bundle protein [Candidatus Omnitrophota bacterium]
MSEKPHKRLVVWQKAIDFIEKIYRVTEQFPSEERFGLVTQMRRAAISVASNLAEGAARQTVKEHLQFYYVARGSISELNTQTEIAHRLQFIDTEQRTAILGELDDISRLLNGLMNSKRGAACLTH